MRICKASGSASNSGWMNNSVVEKLLKKHYSPMNGIGLDDRLWRVLRASFRLEHCNTLKFDSLPIRSEQLSAFINRLCFDDNVQSTITSISMNNCSEIQKVGCLKGLVYLESAQFAWCKNLDVQNVFQSLPRVRDIDLRIKLLALI
ncbi:MAG: hypothetical protein ACI9S8_002185 [Chlamydiales bacterium]|jgi:hypothetical protein